MDAITRRNAPAAGRIPRGAPFAQVLAEKLTELHLRPNIASDIDNLYGTRPIPLLEGSALQDFYSRSLDAIEAQASRTTGRPTFSGEDSFLAVCCMVSAPNLCKAVERASRFYAAISRAHGCPDRSTLKLRVSGPDAELRFFSAAPGPNATASFMSALTGAALHMKLLSWLIGEEIKVVSAATSYHRLIGQEALTELFPWPLTFSTDLGSACDFRLTFSSRYVQRPIIRNGADAESLKVMDLLFTLPRDVSIAVAIRRIFLTAIGRGVPLPSTARLASLCNRSAATLRRHLAREKTSIRAIREECVRDRALQLLEDQSVMLCEIASRLGFSDAPCFRRAFRRWTGKSPSGWRRTLPSMEAARAR